MKDFQWKKILPHVAAILVFLIVAVIYCRPALEGKVLQQSDIVHWKGMAQDAFNYKEKNGHFPLWNTHLFSGMPNYQTAMQNKSILPDFTNILTLGLPKPISFFFLACVCFYILCMAYGTNFLIAIFGSLAFAYATYDPVIIITGHESKMMAIAYMPGLLAGLILLYERKYILGLALTAFFATYEVGVNHPQINYYFFILAVIMTVAYIVRWVKEKQFKHMGIALCLAAFGALIAIGNCAVVLLTTSEYAKYTMRGGKSIESDGKTIKDVKTTGLDVDYALSYSLGKSETAVLMMPNSFGGSSSETLGENSNVQKALVAKGVPEENAAQLAQSMPKYWGGIANGGNPSTSGPPYSGAVICVLFLVGLVVVDKKHRWWILAATVFTILMAWGSYLAGFNETLLKVLPLYDKFRAPSMALVIPQLLLPLMTVLCLQKLFFGGSREELQKSFKKILYVVGGVFVVLVLVYFANDYSTGLDARIKEGYNQNGGDMGTVIVNALQLDRKAMFSSDLLRAFLFALTVIAVVFLYMKKIASPIILVVALLVINMCDLFSIDSKYLNAEQYVDQETYSDNFNPTPAEQEILKDKDPHFRVYNLAPDRFQESLTAYFLRCVGGYHPAKLSVYQDLIENQISKGNMSVLSMLDTRYFIIPAQQPQQQGQQGMPESIQKNDSALGAAWFVKEVKFVNGAAEEMKALDNFNPAQTAFAENTFKNVLASPVATDSSAKIELSSYDNDDIKYTSQNSANGVAVFSEVYYPAGWNAYIDGKKTEYAKVNYALRGLSVPAGKHAIEFKFEPASYYSGQNIVYVAGALLWLCILAPFVVLFLGKRKTATTIKTV